MKGLILLDFVERINVLLKCAKVSWKNNLWFWTNKNFTARDKIFILRTVKSCLDFCAYIQMRAEAGMLCAVFFKAVQVLLVG